MPGHKYNYWVPLADLMTVLMVIFLFMSISYMVAIRKKYTRNDNSRREYYNTKSQLISDLKNRFKDDFKNNPYMILDSSNLSIKFIDKKILFGFDNSELKNEFKKTLDGFLPRYLDILLQNKYIGEIIEVRIEGHTSNEGDYLYNLKLSQDRARNVMGYLYDLGCYRNLDTAKKQRLQYWLTANGLSFGRMVDSADDLVYLTQRPPDAEKCRRVEFRIVIKSDTLQKSLSTETNRI